MPSYGFSLWALRALQVALRYSSRLPPGHPGCRCLPVGHPLPGPAGGPASDLGAEALAKPIVSQVEPVPIQVRREAAAAAYSISVHHDRSITGIFPAAQIWLVVRAVHRPHVLLGERRHAEEDVCVGSVAVLRHIRDTKLAGMAGGGRHHTAVRWSHLYCGHRLPPPPTCAGSSQLLACQLVLGLALVAHVACRPFRDKRLGDLELLSLATLLATSTLLLYITEAGAVRGPSGIDGRGYVAHVSYLQKIGLPVLLRLPAPTCNASEFKCSSLTGAGCHPGGAVRFNRSHKLRCIRCVRDNYFLRG